MAETNEERLVRLETSLGYVSKKADCISRDVVEIKDMIHRHCSDTAGDRIQIKDNKDEIDRLRGMTSVWNIGNSLLAALAGIIGLRQ